MGYMRSVLDPIECALVDVGHPVRKSVPFGTFGGMRDRVKRFGRADGTWPVGGRVDGAGHDARDRDGQRGATERVGRANGSVGHLKVPVRTFGT